MSSMIKTSLVALSILAGASVGYAADNNGGRSDGSGRSFDNQVEAPDLQEREQLIDPNSTGSIQTCESQSFDEFGNCIVTPDMQ
ncbi:hypothetical protein [Rhizobium sp.]